MKYFWTCLLLSNLLYAQNGHHSTDLLQQARDEIAILCSDELAGRGYVDEGHKKAADYLASRFREMGLKPAVKSGRTSEMQYFQSFPIRINLATTASLKIGDKEMFVGSDVIVNRFSGSGQADAKVIDLGYALNPKKYKKTSGKIALFRAGFPPEIANDTEKKKEYKDLSRPIDRISALLVSHPAGIIVVQEKLTAAFTRESARLPIVEVRADALPKQFKKATMTVKSGIENIRSQNVIGMVPGTQYADSVVIISAHYDHLGKLGDAVFAGANDNASGTTMMLSMAEYFSENPLAYSLMFVGFGGEETGLVGSAYYVNESPVVPLEKTKFILNLDLMGNGVDGIMAVGGKDYPGYFDMLVAENEELESVPKVRARKNAPNSDHFFFLKNGVPGFFIYTLGGPPHYHDVNDNASTIELSKYVEIRELLINFLEEIN